MSWLLIHATSRDADLLRAWINASPNVAWIVKADQIGSTYTWRAMSQIDVFAEQEYAIWHTLAGPLNIPSGASDIPDTLVADPFQAWTQTLDHPNATAPWFGGNLPGPFTFQFRESGKEAPDSLGVPSSTGHLIGTGSSAILPIQRLSAGGNSFVASSLNLQ